MRRAIFRLFGLLALLLLAAVSAQAAELFVDPAGLTADAFRSLTEAVAASEAGGTIHLAPGTYQEPDEAFPIEIDKPLTLVAQEGAVLEGPAFKAILRITAPGVTVEGVDFALRRWGILGLADDLTLRGCAFTLADATHRVSSCGVWLAGAYRATIEGCSFTGCGLCIAGPPLSERSKDMPVLTGLFEVGDDLDYFITHTIENNLVNGKPLYYMVGQSDVTVPEDAGGLIAVDCENITIDGLDVSDNSMGIEVIHSKGVKVLNTVADRCGIFGIYLAYIEEGLVQNVTCRHTNHGIDVRKAQNVAVVDCLTEACEQGIFFSWAEESLVDRCRMLYGGTGFFGSVGLDNQISRCMVKDNENGIYLQNEANALVCDNDIMGNTVAGLRMLRSSGQCIGNTVRENWTGVLIAPGEHATLWNNVFSDNGSAGLYMRDLTGGKVVNNTFSGEAGAFLELDGAITGLLLRDNAFYGGQDRVVDRLQSPMDLQENVWTPN